MKKIKFLLDLNKLSIFLIALPYFSFNCVNIINSPFFSFALLLLYLLSILLIDIFLKLILLKINKKAYPIICLLIIYISTLFFYGPYITIYLQQIFKYYFHSLIRGREMIEFATAFFIPFLLFYKNVIHFKYLNIFLILFTVLTTITSITSKKMNRKGNFENAYSAISINNRQIKPILLIVSDEYASPDGLYQIYKDSSLYEFSNHLSKNGWITKNSFYSYETSTIHSLSSLFNFNLSQTSEILKLES